MSRVPPLIALLLWGTAVAVVLLGGSGRAGATSTGEIAVLLRDRVGRDADLDAAPLSPAELAALERAAAVPLTPVGQGSDGSHLLALGGAADARSLRRALAGLRALPHVVYADERPVAVQAGGAGLGVDIDRLLVKLTDRASRDDSDAGRPLSRDWVRRLGQLAGVPLYYERPVSGGAHALRLFQRMPPASVAAIAARLEADPAVAYAEPTVRGRFGTAPDDPLFAEQWPLFAPGGGIRATEAWRWTTGDPSVVVAVIDSGVLADHPDLRGRLLAGFDFVSDVRRSGDLDGRDANPADPGDGAAASECAGGAPATASTWHGTHVAGTLGAATHNRVGIAGVTWAGAVLPLRVGARCGIDPIDLVDAIRWAAGAIRPGARIPDAPPQNPHPARVINLSMEFPGTCPRSLQAAIAEATAAGALVVAAAGNAAAPVDGFHPANCAGVIAVHANDRAGGRTPYSNYGRVDLSAPGGVTSVDLTGGVLSTVSPRDGGTGYGFKEGTSMAAPLVAGTAALVLSVRPELRPSELHALLVATARPFPTGTGADCTPGGPAGCGAGIVDATAAVRAAYERPAFPGGRAAAPAARSSGAQPAG